MMTKGINKWAVVMLVASLSLTGCEKETLPITDSEHTEQNVESGEVKEGYFRANFFPGLTDGATRAAINESSTAIQSLRYWIFQKQEGGTYTYYKTDHEVVLKPEKGGAIQSHEWPLKEGLEQGLELPNGDYKVVFVGNYLPEQFEGQDPAEELVNLGIGTYENMFINMPEGGPGVFNDHNMFYLATAEFSNVNPNPYILMQRVVAKSTFSRDFIRTEDAVGKLVDSLVSQISEGNLSHDLLEGVLSTAITEPLKDALNKLGLGWLLNQVTTIVDRLVNALLGDLVTLLDEALLDYVTDLVNQLLQASVEGGDGTQFSALNVLLNPWANVNSAEVTAYMPASIYLNRVPKGYKTYTNTLAVNGNVTESPKTVTLTTLNGDFTLSSIVVDKGGIIGNALENLDGKLLDGLLIDITTPISYTQESNLYYNTTYDFLNLNLKADENVTVDLGTVLEGGEHKLTDVINEDRLVAAILGDGILSSLLGKVADEIVAPLIVPLLEAVGGLKITLPNIAVGKISIDGRWGATTNSVGVVIPTEIGETGE